MMGAIAAKRSGRRRATSQRRCAPRLTPLPKMRFSSTLKRRRAQRIASRVTFRSRSVYA
jgi:hypothetical protein